MGTTMEDGGQAHRRGGSLIDGEGECIWAEGTQLITQGKVSSEV